MSAALLYLLQGHLILLLFAAGGLLLRKLTFFSLNRAYLLLALLVAALAPALPAIPAWWAPAQALAPGLAGRWLVLPAAAPAAPAAAGPDWQLGLLALYAAGAAGLLGRLLLQGLALRRLHRASWPATHHGLAYRAVSLPIGPCSFWQAIYLNPEGLTPAELTAALRHEQAHVRQWHTLDVLLGQLLSALAWPNPAAWGVRRAMLTNLEYLADRHALRGGATADRRAYQLSLLRLAQAGSVSTAPVLTTSFLFSPLKTRILMLNQPASPTRQAARYLLLAPLLALTLGLNAACSDSAPTAPEPAYYIDGQRSTKGAAHQFGATPQLIARMEVVRGEDARRIFNETQDAVVITTKGNENAPAVQALSVKMARAMPAPPPPPPPVVIPAAALAYLTKTYPGYRLIGASQQTAATGKGSVLNLEIAIGRRPKHVLFDEEGQFLKEQ